MDGPRPTDQASFHPCPFPAKRPSPTKTAGVFVGDASRLKGRPLSMVLGDSGAVGCGMPTAWVLPKSRPYTPPGVPSEREPMKLLPNCLRCHSQEAITVSASCNFATCCLFGSPSRKRPTLWLVPWALAERPGVAGPSPCVLDVPSHIHVIPCGLRRTHHVPGWYCPCDEGASTARTAPVDSPPPIDVW